MDTGGSGNEHIKDLAFRNCSKSMLWQMILFL